MQPPRTAICNFVQDGQRPDHLSVARGKPKLLDQLHQALRSRHYSTRTDQSYCHWGKQFICFHNVRHRTDITEPEVNYLLTHLAVKAMVSASTQNQAHSTLLPLYRRVMGATGET